MSFSETLDSPPDNDFGLHWDDGTVELCHNLLALYGVLPEEGGVLDQDWFLMNDIARWGSKRTEIGKEVKPAGVSSAYEQFMREWNHET